ncbi:hypothetical protein Tco_0345018 [Tanacetum coccineum]
MIIVPEEGMNVEALQTKYPIIDWEVYTEDSRKYWKIIRVGNHTEVYHDLSRNAKEFYRDDLDKLWSLVMKDSNSTEPIGDKERELFGLQVGDIRNMGIEFSLLSSLISEEVPTEYALMAKSSSSSDNEVYDDSFCSKSCRKNTENLNNKVIKLNEELSDCETDLYNYKRGLSQVEARLVEFKENEIKFCERIRVLERDIEIRDNKIENLRNELEEVKKEKESIHFKIEKFDNASKDLDSLPEFVDDTVTDYSRPTPSIDVSKDVTDEQKAIWKSNSASFFEQRGSVGNVVSKPMIRPRGNQRNWNNQKSQQLGSDFVMIKKACYVCGSFEHLQYTCKHKRHVNDQKQVKPVWNNSKRVNHHYSTRITHPNPKRNMIPQAILMRSGRKTINAAKPKAVHNAVKASACWVWKPKNRVIDHVSKYNNASMTLKRFDYIDAQGRFKSVMAWMDAQTQGRHEHDQEFDAKITTVGAEVDDITAET